jgi:mRNA interferase HigB
VHIISLKRLKEYCAVHPDTEESLQTWYHCVQAAAWGSSADLKRQFGSASVINSERVVFNIRGNEHRLVVRINYAGGTVFIRFIGTHKEYDRIDVETV